LHSPPRSGRESGDSKPTMSSSHQNTSATGINQVAPPSCCNNHAPHSQNAFNTSDSTRRYA
jgi:hypothetical protein